MSMHKIQLPSCIICFSVCKDPTVDACGHTFCAVCLKDWRKKNTICPFTKNAGKMTTSSNLSLRNLLTSDSRCNFADNGCSWSGNIKHLGKYHLDNCVFKSNTHRTIQSLLAKEASHLIAIETIELSDGTQFHGLLDKDQKRVLGLIKSEGEVCYQGQFANDLFDGVGKLFHKTEIVYEGQFSEGLKHGYGVIYKNVKPIIEGLFDKGRPSGECILYSPSKRYKGTLDLSENNSEGKFSFSNGNVFTGSFNEFLPTKGSLVYADGQKISSMFVDLQPTGIGLLEYPSGNYYDGNFKEGLFEEQGKLFVKSSEIEFSGIFSKGKKNGQFTLKQKDNLFCSGEYSNDVANGNWTFHNSKGSKLNCTVVAGKIQPDITILYSRGDRFEGSINLPNDKDIESLLEEIPNGSSLFDKELKGTLFYVEGDKYTGRFIKELREKAGKFEYKNGDLLKCNFTNDQAEGEGIIEFKDGSELKGGWKMGKLEGLSLLYEKKQLVAKHIWRNGVMVTTVPISEPKAPVKSSRGLLIKQMNKS
jgi:hypothetical protein